MTPLRLEGVRVIGERVNPTGKKRFQQALLENDLDYILDVAIQQEDGKVNKVHITPEKVYMETSTCENQDCVGQGEITLDNYRTRILSTYVICLPNAVTIEMVPVE